MKYSITLIFLLSLFSLFCLGCDALNNKEADVKKTEKKTTQKSDPDNSKRKVTKKSRVAVQTGSLESGSSGTVTTKTVSQSFSSADAVNSLFEVIADSISFAPTLIICCLDETPSSQQFVKSATDQIQNSFSDNATDDEKLLFAVAGFGDDFHLLTDEPVSKPDDLKNAFSKLGQGKSETENGLSAVKQAYEKFREYKTDKRYQIMVVVVTDEAPSDREILDETVSILAGDESPVYVIGNPAPFGRQTVGQMNSSAGMMNYGPETIALERIDSDYWMDYGGMEALDSGFGPWAWERLCRKTQGRFLAVRPSGGFSGVYGRGWPASSRQFDPGVMARYAPDYGSEKEYLASLEANSAKMALHNAAKLSRTKFNMVRGAEIMTGDEAAMARNLNRIQQPIAAGLLPVQNLYEALKAGEADRDKLDSPRWKASYDLAYGRAVANYVRLDGANSMMAKAKSGMKFSDPSNNKWSLQPSDEINTGGAHTRLAETATKLLQGIVDNYPDTPWAYIAEQELKSPMGWEWVEGK